jgi:hypothetical protein
VCVILFLIFSSLFDGLHSSFVDFYIVSFYSDAAVEPTLSSVPEESSTEAVFQGLEVSAGKNIEFHDDISIVISLI